VRPLFEIQNIKLTVLCATFGDSPTLRNCRRVMSGNSLSAVGYLFEVRVPVIVYHGGDVATQRVSVQPLFQNLKRVNSECVV